MTEALRLYPPPQTTVPLAGLCLQQRLREGGPLVYSNFIASLDGRIAVPDAQGRSRVPPAIANPRDWRLYMELLAQADVVLTTGRHLRAVAAGRQADLLNITEQEHHDLIQWRRQRGLPPHPDCVAVSHSLDVPAKALCAHGPQRVAVLTHDGAARERVAALSEAGIEVMRARGNGALNGRAAIDALHARGYRYIYSIAGPRVLHALLEADVLDRLYFTSALLTLGGERFDTLVRGQPFASPRGFSLAHLYYDPGAPVGASQLFMRLDRRRAP